VTSDRPHRHAARRVVIVDADRRVRRDLAELLALTPGTEIVGSAPDGPSALAQLAEADPDVVVVDPRLPSVEDGIAFLDRVRDVSAARIVVLSHDAGLRQRALAHGADAFLTESDPLSAILEAVGVEASPA
jgi:DNA-binding NarL/FixJ family response regulator